MEEKMLSKTYNPQEIEGDIYKLWLNSGAFHAAPDGRGADKRYVVMMPLPNVTGALHMGHAMDNMMQDLLIRWHRMMGDNTLWMPGTDHAGIATQAVVEKRLMELEGLNRHDLGRDGLVKRIWQWKDQYQARIIDQQQRMGCSCDWKRQRFTMDKVCARAVRHIFFKMFSDGLIFKGKRLVNWDVFLRTTISDDEMVYEKTDGHFWHLRYPIIDPKKGEPRFVIVATTRPETMLGDTAVAVHPDPEGELNRRIAEIADELVSASQADSATLEEERRSLLERKESILPQLILLRDMARDGRMVDLPLLNRKIPLICDEWAKPGLGSGCVKITPAHDPNDYAVWQRHKHIIGIINILNPDGTLNAEAGPYKGLDRFAAREKVVEDLNAKGLLDKVEDRVIEIANSDRSKTPVEPYLSDQWFVRMGDVHGGIVMGKGTKKEHRSNGLVQSAIDAVTDGRVKIHPARYAKTYLDWLAEKRDWPISRQLWWGHRIPVWSKKAGAIELKKSKPFSRLEALFKSDPGAKSLVLVRVQSLETDTSVLIDNTALGSCSFDGIGDEELARIDICLLNDREDITTALSASGFEQDPDVLDTWFSSALWPFSTLGWPDPATAELEPGQAPLGSLDGNPDCAQYYYPGSCLVTARDIITLWVARMVLAGLYALGDVPFSDVFIHANILDGKGVRMSKSKGNGIDPVDIISAYGTDAMRYVLADMQTGTQDIKLPVTAVCPVCGFHNDLTVTIHGSNIFCYVCGKNSDGSMRKGGCGKEFDVLGTLPDLPQAKLVSEKFEIGKAFCTKLWNSARFAFMNMSEISSADVTKKDLMFEDRWILNELSGTIRTVTDGFKAYNPSIALNTARDFFWHSLCDWYLELIKARLNSPGESRAIAQKVLAFCLDQVLRLLHPLIPYITECIWQTLQTYFPSKGLGSLVTIPVSEQLIKSCWPQSFESLEDTQIAQAFAELQTLTRAIREVRADRSIPPKQELSITIKPQKELSVLFRESLPVMTNLAGVKDVSIDAKAFRPRGAASKIVSDITIFIHDIIDDDAEKKRLADALKKAELEIAAFEKKLSNREFTDKAPRDVVARQQEKLGEHKTNRDLILTHLRELE
jgi:valyl-tRNA synthetase